MTAVHKIEAKSSSDAEQTLIMSPIFVRSYPIDSVTLAVQDDAAAAAAVGTHGSYFVEFPASGRIEEKLVIECPDFAA